MKRKEQLRIQSEREWLEEVQAELHPDKIDDNAQIQEIEQELSDLQNQLEDMDEREKIEEKLAAEGIKATSAMEQHELTPPKLMLGYFLMVLFRSLVEIGFLYWYFQMYVFDLVMPKEYRCNASPCLRNVFAIFNFDEFQIRWLKILHYQDRNKSFNFYFDSVIFHHLK